MFVRDKLSGKKFSKNGTRDRQMSRGETQTAAFQIEKALGAKRIDLAEDSGQSSASAVCVWGGIVEFNAGQVDSVELAEAEEKFFFECLLQCDRLDLLARGNSLLD